MLLLTCIEMNGPRRLGFFVHYAFLISLGFNGRFFLGLDIGLQIISYDHSVAFGSTSSNHCSLPVMRTWSRLIYPPLRRSVNTQRPVELKLAVKTHLIAANHRSSILRFRAC